jgi:hypothetical protein
MRERSEQILRLVSLVLGALLLFQLARIFAHRNPVAQVQIPAVPTLETATSATNAPATNAVHAVGSSKISTNKVAASASTNAVAQIAGSNTVPAAEAVVLNQSTNTSTEPRGTNTSQQLAEVKPAGTNVAPSATNTVSAKKEGGPTSTNVAAAAASSKAGTNAPAGPVVSARPEGPGAMPRGMGGPGGMPGKPKELPPEILARVDRVVDSELLGPVMRPLPMALLGIAGNIAFLRAPNGQTGLVKEGDDLGGVKLVRIGINRVLVEKEGKKEELMIFSGMGGESLLSN